MVTEKNIVNFSFFDILLVSSIFVQCSRPIYKYLYKYIYPGIPTKKASCWFSSVLAHPKKIKLKMPISSYNLLTTNDMQVNSS